MRAILFVLTAFVICAAFIVFFASFIYVPLILLGGFVLLANSSRRRRKPAPAPAGGEEGDGGE